MFKNNWSLKKDLPSSLVVFLVALPLSLGIALASGAPVKTGLIAAVIGGIVVGLLGGAPLQVSGPAAGLTVMVYGFIQKFGFEATCPIGFCAGVFQILLGAFGVGQMTLVFSPAVIHAMLAGIGILISLGQFHVLLGLSPKGSAIANIGGVPDALQHMNVHALIAGTLTLVTLFTWNRYLTKRFRSIPGSLVSVVLGTLLTLVFAWDVPRVSVSSNFLDHFSLPVLHGVDLLQIAFAAVALTLVASAESLLCAVATDKLHSGPPAKLNKELMAQGVGNIVSGLLGGLPITGVIVRSSANISAGAGSNLSAILHGVWILIFATFFSGMLSKIPLSVLAGLLIYIGVKLVKLHEYKSVSQFGEAVIYVVTLVGVVFINLLWGIGLGFALATIMLLYRMSRLRMEVNKADNGINIVLTGTLSFLSVPKLIELLRAISLGEKVFLKLNVAGIDHASIEAIRDWKNNYVRTGGQVIKDPLEEIWKESRKLPAKITKV